MEKRGHTNNSPHGSKGQAIYQRARKHRVHVCAQIHCWVHILHGTEMYARETTKTNVKAPSSERIERWRCGWKWNGMERCMCMCWMHERGVGCLQSISSSCNISMCLCYHCISSQHHAVDQSAMCVYTDV